MLLYIKPVVPNLWVGAHLGVPYISMWGHGTLIWLYTILIRVWPRIHEGFIHLNSNVWSNFLFCLMTGSLPAVVALTNRVLRWTTLHITPPICPRHLTPAGEGKSQDPNSPLASMERLVSTESSSVLSLLSKRLCHNSSHATQMLNLTCPNRH